MTEELEVEFELLPRSTLEAEMELVQRDEIEATFELNINADGRDAKINGVNTLTLTATDGIELTQVGDVATLSAPSIVQGIADEKEAREQADATLQDNIDAEATARENADDTLQDNIDAEETARKDADEDLQDAIDTKQPIINDLDTIRSNAQAGKQASDTIATYGDIVTHDVDEFATAAQGALADTALQQGDNVSELLNDAGYLTGITSLMVTTALGYTPYDATNPNGYISGITSSDVTSALGYTPYNATNPNNYQTGTQVSNAVGVETTNRENADIALQQQIDAITASSDVKDIVGTYAELQQYDTSTLGNNDIIKVLQDETQNGATTYYRWNTTTQTFTLIGQEGPYYTKSEADSEFVPQTRTVNGKALSSDITLTASDVGALPSSTTIGDGTLTIQKNGTSVATFTANSATNTTANITVPTKTSDLINDDGFITGITSSDVTTALGFTPYDSSNPSGYISGITSLMVTTALGYTPYDASNPNGYISGITSSDVTTALGYTPVDPSNLATVATTGDYDDLINKPTIPTSSDYWTVGNSNDTSVQKTYGRKILTYKATNDQDNGFKLLGTEWVPSGSYSGYWLGRMLLGTNKHTFLLGTVINGQGNYMCGLGAHSWTDAEAQTGAAWEDVYIQPDGNKAVYLGGRQWRVDSGWMKVQNDGSGNAAYRTFINTGSNTSPTWRAILPNQASGTNSVLIRQNISSTFSYTYATSINGTITANYGTSFGYNASAGSYGVSIGYDSAASGSYSIQIGRGTNSTANTMNVGLSNTLNVQLLDASGEIPDARIKTTIARVSQIPTQASDIGALPDSTDYAADLSYSSNTLQLLDQDGNALGSPVTITASSSLATLTDVTLTTPTSGQALLYDGSKWVNGSAGVSATYDAVNERITFA